MIAHIVPSSSSANMQSLKKLPVKVAVIGLLVTCAGTILTSQGVPRLGRALWASGSIVTLLGLVSFLAANIYVRAKQHRAKSRSTASRVFAEAAPIILMARFTSVVLTTLGVIFLGTALYQLFSATFGWRPGTNLALYSVASGFSTLAMGLGLWLIAQIASRVDQLILQTSNSRSRDVPPASNEELEAPAASGSDSTPPIAPSDDSLRQ